MRNAKRHAFRFSSKPCSICEELSRLNARIDAPLAMGETPWQLNGLGKEL